MNNVIVVASGKGGTGKSTVAVSLAAAFVKMNRRVLLIDCDSGMRGLDLMLDVESEILFDCADAVRGNCRSSEAVYRSRNLEGLSLMAAPFSTDNEISPSVFRQLVDEIRPGYDYVIVDSPAGLGSGLATAAAPADRALIVTNAEPVSLRGAVKLRHRLVELGVPDIRLVINRFDRRQFNALGRYNDLDEVIDIIGAQLIALVPYDPVLSAVMQNGRVGLSFTPADNVFNCLALRLEGCRLPLAFRG